MKKNEGLTLVELIVTLSVMVIALTIGVPNLTSFLKDNDLVNTTNTIASNISFARSEATKRQSPVTVCISDNNTGCIDVTAMNANSNLIVLSSDDQLLRTTPMSTDIDLYYSSTQLVTFSAKGTPTSVEKIIICDDRGQNHAKGLSINLGGQVRPLVNTELNSISCS